jgi:tetratricopeptide (TPR) repeat protein
VPALSERLVQASSRDAAYRALASVEGQPAAFAFVEALASRRDTPAANVALALAELSQDQRLRKEARRALVRLRSAGIAPDFSVPAIETPPSQQPSRAFYAGYVSQTREQGEVQVALAWCENQAAGDVRGLVFLLEFWRDGVKDFFLTDLTTAKRFDQDYSHKKQIAVAPCTVAQARQLVQEALSINTWRKTSLPGAYKTHYLTIRELLLDAPISEEEEEAVAREGDRPWIARDLEPDEVVGNFLGAWSFGDYGLAYDLLADDHPARRAQTRDEYIEQRRQWADEAEPLGLRMLVIRERAAEAQQAQRLWVPTGYQLGAHKEVEAFWSLLLKDSPLGGQMEELPMATIINRETGRHWYWTSYTLVQQQGVWHISRQRDQGLTAQGIPIPDLQKLVDQQTEEANRIGESRPESAEAAEEAYRNLVGAVATGLHYRDALMARLPLDRAPYEQAALDARALGQYERADAYYLKMLDRFGDRARLLLEQGIVQFLAGEREQQEGNQAGAQRWWDRAGVSLEEAVSLHPNADAYQVLAELRTKMNRLEDAEQLVRQAIELDDTHAERWAELGTIQMNRNNARGALESFEQAVKRNPELPGIYFFMGRAYLNLNDPENARLAYEEALRRNPNDPEILNNLAALLQKDQPARAIELLERAVALAPNVALYHANLAALHLQSGSLKRGRTELEQAERLDPSHPVARQARALLNRR